MQRRRIFCVAAGLACTISAPQMAISQVTIRLSEVPPKTPAAAHIYVAGSFNNWDPGAAAFQLTQDGNGGYAITLPATVSGAIEFKFTLGSWDRVETDSAGSDVDNRRYMALPGTTYQGIVAGWKSGHAAPRRSTAGRGVSVLDAAMEMPALGRARRVWIYLPPDYATTTKTYPVLYMHDGQNLFDDTTSFAGEWGVDETLDSLHAAGDWGVIVIGVDHGRSARMSEYAPWPTRFGPAEGDAYLAFMVNTLKPRIDASYRTRPDRLHTGIAGSSMGGLISLYAALKYPAVFGRAGIFSPALWLAPAADSLAAQARPTEPDQRLYFVSGSLESAPGEAADRYIRDQQRIVDTLERAGFRMGNGVTARIVPDGKHAEWFWRREFAAAYQALFRRN